MGIISNLREMRRAKGNGENLVELCMYAHVVRRGGKEVERVGGIEGRGRERRGERERE